VGQRSWDTVEALKTIGRLRRAERSAAPGVRGEIVSGREFVQDLVGPTVRPADAARLLGVSQPALIRWTDKGDIATVLTPDGRREIPTSELVELFDELERSREAGGKRPLGRVIRERHRRSAETIDLDRLLPRPRPRGHRTAELQSLAYHRLVAERLDEHIVDDARRRLRSWRRDGRIHPRWADAWESVLNRSLPEISKAISADTSRARQLGQTSPFAGVLTEQERRRLLRAVEERALA
jgi:hypothetical protein